MPHTPDPHEIVRRFNAACAAFDAAITASHARNVEHYNAALVRAARDVGSALELSLLRCVGLARPEELTRARKPDFPQMIELLRKINEPLLGNERVQELKRWRSMRNRAEHHPIDVPSLRELLQALLGTRRFLVEAFGELTDLADPEQPVAPLAFLRVDQPAQETPAPLDDAHRQAGPEGWTSIRLDEGLQRLNAGRTEHSPLDKEDVRQSLSRLAWALVELGAAPDGSIPAEVLRTTLGEHRRLYLEAGWLVAEANCHRFHDPRLPALLVGLDFARESDGFSEMRVPLGGRRRWSEAAWAATAAGDLVTDWLRPLLDDSEIDRLPDRVVTACAALAGLHFRREGTISDLVERTAAVTGVALVWLIPLCDTERTPSPEAWDAWRLERAEWQRAMLDLALATKGLPAFKPSTEWKRPGGALGRLVEALGLLPRLSDEAAQAVLLLAWPWARDGASPLDERFFKLLFSIDSGLAGRVDTSFLKIWVTEIGVPALWQGDARRAARMMVVPDMGHPAGYLLNNDELRPDWCEAWECFAKVASADEAARTWVLGATRVSKSGRLDDAVATFLLHDAPELLRARGAWETARAMLEEALSPNVLPTQPDEQQLHHGAMLFALAGLSQAKWSQLIAQWSAEPRLPWRLLIEAGAPHEAVARWCVDKLRQKERDAPNLDGPVGIIASGGEILASNGWQLAFRQAREALDWLLDHGDEGAVTILADACFAADAALRFDPIVARYIAGLSVPLSQVLWGRVISRPSGRAALYARLERGAGFGGIEHFLPGAPWLSITDGVWEKLAVHLSLPLYQSCRAPSSDETAEACRLLRVFEQWMAEPQPTFWRLKPERPLWADPAMRSAKTLMVLCGALHDLDVTEPLHTLLRSVVDDANAQEKELLVLLGTALNRLCQRPGEPPVTLLALATTPQVAAQLAHDKTWAFWTALLRHLGLEAVTRLLDALALPDLGLGLFDALASVAPEALDQDQERPDLTRAVLVRSAEGRFRPSHAFHERAWARPRRPEEIRDLDQIPAGDWVRGLIEQSRRWPASERADFLRWLAQRSRHDEVRRSCLQVLLDDGCG